MKIHEMFKIEDGKKLFLIGNFTSKEIKEHKREGYRFNKKN